MSTSIFNLRDDDEIEEKIDIDELYEKRRQADENNVVIFNKVLNRIHQKIKRATMLDKNSTDIWYVIPEMILGVPKYDIGLCIGYIVDKLRDNGFNIRYFHPNTILVSWGHWVPTYVRDQVKKKLNTKIDGLGNIIDEPSKEKDDPTGLFPGMNNKSNSKKSSSVNPNTRSTSSYKPTGKFIYNTDFFSDS